MQINLCALENYNLNSREKVEPGPGLEPQTSRPLEIRDSNPGPGSNFSLEFKIF